MNRFALMLCAGLLAAVGAAEPARDDAAARIVMETAVGEIEIEVYPEQAPLTAGNFLRLVDGGHLDGASFYRTVSPANDNGSPVISVIQGGLGDSPGPFSPIVHETTRESGLAHLDGTISMARAAVGTASSEFFICIGDQPALDFGGARNADGQGFAAFGRVVGGMEVVRLIHAMPANAPTDSEYVKGQMLDDQVVIRSVRRL